MKYSKLTKLRGFSLIELLIVMTIIGILVTISMTSYASAQRRSRDTTRKAQVLNISSAIERYRSANGVYAPEYCTFRAAGGAKCYSGTTYLGGNGVCVSQVSDDNMDTPDTAFDEDPLHKTESGFLLKFMGKPRTLTSTISGAIPDAQSASTCFFGTSTENPTSLKNGRIRITTTRDLYWVYVALENKGEKRSPAGSICKKFPGNGTEAPAYYTGVFLAYNEACGAGENDMYKIFSRGSYGEPNPN